MSTWDKCSKEHCACCVAAEKEIDELETAIENLEEKIFRMLLLEKEEECRRCGKSAILNSNDYCSRSCELGYTVHPALLVASSSMNKVQLPELPKIQERPEVKKARTGR